MGGAGFIGFHLAKHLADQGNQVVICDNLFRGRRDADFEQLLEKSNVTFHDLDLTERAQLAELPTDCDVIFHLAAINGTRHFYEIPYQVIRTNLLSLINVLDWMGITECKSFVWASSPEVYAGSVEVYDVEVPTPESVPLTITDVSNPRFSYAGSKIAGELLCFHFANTSNAKIIALRIHNAYGPREGYEHVIPQFIVRILERQNPFVIYGAEQTRSFCFVDDIVRGMILAAELPNDRTVTTINIGNDQEVSVLEIAENLFDLADFHPAVDLSPSPLGSVDRRCPDLGIAREILGYEPQIGLEEGLRRTFQWYSQNHGSNTTDVMKGRNN